MALGLVSSPPVLCDADKPRKSLPDAELAKIAARPLTEDEARAAADGVATLPKSLRGYSPTGHNRAALERILADCRARNIEVILVGVPTPRVHREMLNEIRPAYRKALEEIQSDFGVKYHDMETALPDHLFYDYHHSLEPSEIFFSRMVCQEFLASRWRTMQQSVPGATVSHKR